MKDENANDIVIKVGLLIGVDIRENDVSVGHCLPQQSYRDEIREVSQGSSIRAPARAPNIAVKVRYIIMCCVRYSDNNLL